MLRGRRRLPCDGSGRPVTPACPRRHRRWRGGDAGAVRGPAPAGVRARGRPARPRWSGGSAAQSPAGSATGWRRERPLRRPWIFRQGPAGVGEVHADRATRPSSQSAIRAPGGAASLANPPPPSTTDRPDRLEGPALDRRPPGAEQGVPLRPWRRWRASAPSSRPGSLHDALPPGAPAQVGGERGVETGVGRDGGSCARRRPIA